MESKPALKKPVFITTKEVDPGTRVNMHLKVHSVNITRERLRFDNTKMIMADCVVGDQYGCVTFNAKNEQLDIIKEGSVITVRNAHANVVNEHLKLEVDRWGKIENSSVDIPSVDLKNDLSAVEYELVSAGKR